MDKDTKATQAYVVIRASQLEMLEERINALAAQGYVLHSFSMLNVAQQGETMRYVAIMERPLVTIEIGRHPVLDWWQSLSQETAMALAAQYDIRLS